MKILVINGPNINMLGIREPGIYGKQTFADLLTLLEQAAEAENLEIEQYQSNHEGNLVDKIQAAYGSVDGIVINPAAYTHTSVAILDALKSVAIPAVEVHISDVDSREDFRQISYAGMACIHTIKGQGLDGYRQAIVYLKEYLAKKIEIRVKLVTVKEKMHSCQLYFPGDPEIMKEQTQCLEKLYDFNATRPLELDKRSALLKEMFAEIGENCYIEPPLHSNWGGHHVHFGKGVYANFNLTLVDDTHIYVGDYTMFGPNVTIATAGHPLLPELRQQGLQYNAPVRIGRNCWIGAGAVIVPGITIGDNVVVGAGSIVTKDLPDNVVAVGNPCKILREINEHDKKFYFKNNQINYDEL